MALYHWLKFLAGLWFVWFVFTVLGVINGYLFNVVDMMISVVQPYIHIPENILNSIIAFSNTYIMLFNVFALLIFSAAILYLYVNSSRRE